MNEKYEIMIEAQFIVVLKAAVNYVINGIEKVYLNFRAVPRENKYAPMC